MCSGFLAKNIVYARNKPAEIWYIAVFFARRFAQFTLGSGLLCEQKMNMCLTGDCEQQTDFMCFVFYWLTDTLSSTEHSEHVRLQGKHWNKDDNTIGAMLTAPISRRFGAKHYMFVGHTTSSGVLCWDIVAAAAASKRCFPHNIRLGTCGTHSTSEATFGAVHISVLRWKLGKTSVWHMCVLNNGFEFSIHQNASSGCADHNHSSMDYLFIMRTSGAVYTGCTCQISIVLCIYLIGTSHRSRRHIKSDALLCCCELIDDMQHVTEH